MSDLVTPVLILLGVIAVSVVLFGGWVVVSIFRTVGTWLDRGSARAGGPATAGRPCANASCRLTNPPHARFCKQCGSPVA